MQANCTICHDMLDSIVDVSTTNCGHIFHKHCIRQWLLQSHTCPECRGRVMENNLTEIFFYNLSTWRNIVPSYQLAKKQLREKKKETTRAKRKVQGLLTKCTKNAALLDKLQQKRDAARAKISSDTEKLKSFSHIQARNTYLMTENHELDKQRSHLADLKIILKGTSDDTKYLFSDKKWKHLGKKNYKKLTQCCCEAKEKLESSEREYNQMEIKLSQLESEKKKFQAAPKRNLRSRNEKK